MSSYRPENSWWVLGDWSAEVKESYFKFLILRIYVKKNPEINLIILHLEIYRIYAIKHQFLINKN